MPRRAALAILAASLVACDGRGGEPDAGAPEVDAGAARVAAPVWECPDGWSARADGACEPWPSGEACADGQVRYPGDATCHGVGRACPAGAFPDGVAEPAIYVEVGASGGDGSRAAPLGTLAEAVAAASAGATIVLSAGEHVGGVTIPAGVTLRGACPGRTTVRAGGAAAGSLGVLQVAGTGARIEDVTLTGERPGISLDGDPTPLEVTLSGVVIEGAYAIGIAAGFDATVRGGDVLIRGTRELASPSGTQRYGIGLSVTDGARAELERVALVGNQTFGALVATGGEASLDRAVIRDTRADGVGSFGRGLDVEADAALTLRRSVVEASRDCGVHTALDSAVTLEEVVVRDTAPRERDGFLGCGMSVLDGARATVDRGLFDGNRYYGVGVRGAASALTLSDAWIVGTSPSDVATGLGVLAEGGASVTVARARLLANHAQGVLLRGATARLDDLEVADTESDPTAGDFGRGIEASGGSQVTGRGVRLVGNRDASLAAFDPGTSITLEAVDVSGTRERACAADLCEGLGAGVGVAVALGGAIALTDFVLDDHALAGAQLIEGDLLLTDGEVRNNPIGVNLQVEGFDLARIQGTVDYVENGRNLVRESVGPPPTPATL